MVDCSTFLHFYPHEAAAQYEHCYPISSPVFLRRLPLMTRPQSLIFSSDSGFQADQFCLLRFVRDNFEVLCIVIFHPSSNFMLMMYIRGILLFHLILIKMFCVSTCVLVEVYVHICKRLEATFDSCLGCCLSCFLNFIFFLRQGLLLAWNSLRSPAGQQAPGIHLSSASQCWDYQ